MKLATSHIVYRKEIVVVNVDWKSTEELLIPIQVLQYWLLNFGPGADPGTGNQPAGDFLSHPRR